MAHLPVRVRGKAIEIGNALLAQGYEEGRAIRIGIAQAKRWAGVPVQDHSARQGPNR